VIIIKTNNAFSFSEKLKSSNQIWADLIQINQVHIIDSVIAGLKKQISSNSQTHTLLQESPLYLSCHFMGYSKFKNLVSIAIPKTITTASLQSFIKQYGRITEREFEGNTIFELNHKASKSRLSFAIIDGVFAITNSSLLIEKLVYQSLKEDDEKKDELTKELVKMSGVDVETNMFVNYKYFYRFLTKYSAKSYIKIIKKIANIAQKSTFDLAIKENHIMANGYSLYTDSSLSYLSALSKDNTGEFNASKIMPFNTSVMIFIGAEDYKKHYENLEAINWKVSNRKELEGINKQLDSDVRTYFYPWMKNELIFVSGKTSFNKLYESSIAIFGCTDVKEAEQRIDELALKVNQTKGHK